MSILKLTNLNKKFETPAVSNVSLTLEQGQILCLLGPSGCGKTTLLRMISGLEQPDEGKVIFEGRDITHVPPHERGFGMMFQEFALFPHKTVYENIAFGLHMQKKSSSEIYSRTREMLELAGLAELAPRNVADLSGGERQRVALARSLAPQPGLIMLDEPLGSLDKVLRERLLSDIHSILKKLHITAIFVTHDQTEALVVSDMIAVMNQGRLLQIAPPEELYRNPGSVFIARFLGFQNLIPGRVTTSGIIETAVGTFKPPKGDYSPQEQVTLVLRPENVLLDNLDNKYTHKDNKGRFLCGRVKSRLFTGRSYRIKVASDSNLELTFDLPNDKPPPLINEDICLAINPASISIIRS